MISKFTKPIIYIYIYCQVFAVGFAGMKKLLYEASAFRTATYIWGVTRLRERSERNN